MRKSFAAGLAVALFASPQIAQADRSVEELWQGLDALSDRIEKLEEKSDDKAPAADDLTFRVFFKDGLKFQTLNEQFEFQIGGRTFVDFAFFETDRDVRAAIGGDNEDGAEFRAARLFVSGTLYQRVIFKAEYDFAGGDADFKDVYIGLEDVPVLGTVKVGHFKEPFSLEELTSSRFVTFMERASPNLFAPGRNTGAAFQNAVADKRVTYAFGGFRESDDFGTSGIEDSWNLTGRVTALPYRDGGNVVHLGVAYSHKFIKSNGADVRLRQRPEAHLARRFVDTGTFEAENMDLLGAEAAVVFGPFSAQGEFVQAWVDTGSGLQNIDEFRGGYALVSYFLTGESRKYKDSSGAFDRVKPKENFWSPNSDNFGKGAWELAGRFSHLKLSDRDAPIMGGEMNNFTAGINWYLNPNVRVMGNWIYSYLAGVDDSQIFQMRFQVDF